MQLNKNVLNEIKEGLDNYGKQLTHNDLVRIFQIFFLLSIFLAAAIFILGVSYMWLASEKSYKLTVYFVGKEGTFKKIAERSLLDEQSDSILTEAAIFEYLRAKYDFFGSTAQKLDAEGQKVRNQILAMFGDRSDNTRAQTSLVQRGVEAVRVVPKEMLIESNDYVESSDPAREVIRVNLKPEDRRIIAKVKTAIFYKLNEGQEVTRVIEREIYLEFRFVKEDELEGKFRDPRNTDKTKFLNINPLMIEVISVVGGPDAILLSETKPTIFDELEKQTTDYYKKLRTVLQP